MGSREILYAFTSAANNNGSAFAGISANTAFYNVALGIAMWLGRFWPIVAVLAIAGSLAAKKRIAGDRRHHADTRRAVRRAADRHHRADRRPELSSRRWRWGRWSSI